LLRGRGPVWLLVHALAAVGRAIPTADGIAVIIRNDGIAPLLCEEFTVFRAEIATDAGRCEHQQMIVETTGSARENVRVR